MANCPFTTKYLNYESQAVVDYFCDSKDEDILSSGKCIFHDEDYLQSDSLEEKNNVRAKLMIKVAGSIAGNGALVCIGYYLPDVTIAESFIKPAYFKQCRFQGRADFSSAEFSEAADFSSTNFFEITEFSFAKFSGEADFATAFFREAHFDSAKFSGQADLPLG